MNERNEFFFFVSRARLLFVYKSQYPSAFQHCVLMNVCVCCVHELLKHNLFEKVILLVSCLDWKSGLINIFSRNKSFISLFTYSLYNSTFNLYIFTSVQQKYRKRVSEESKTQSNKKDISTLFVGTNRLLSNNVDKKNDRIVIYLFLSL